MNPIRKIFSRLTSCNTNACRQLKTSISQLEKTFTNKIKFTTMTFSKIFIPALVSLTFLVSCDRHEQPVAKDDSLVPDSLIKTLQTAPVTMEEMTDQVKLNGKIIPNETKQAKVYALVSGKINSVSVELGDHVQKGKALAVLQSSEVAGVANDLSVAQSNVDMSKKNLQSMEEMYKSSLATERDVISARLEVNKANSELNRATQVSSITGGKNATYVLRAPLSGYVIEKTITNNSEVRQDNNANLFTIADLSSVWIIANVFEADIKNIHIGDEVVVSTLADPEKSYKGKIDKIYDVLDPANRTMKVRISLANPDNILKPEMFATINVTGRSSGKTLCIPSEAVVLDNSKRYVIVKSNPDSVAIREIEIVKRIGDKTFIKGLKEGEKVVTKSQVFIFEALNSK
jgi:cobalt-zinc-cadmium efflux system membrane fusion protein